MNKSIRQISKIVIYLTANLLILGIFCTNSNAQTEPLNARISDVWVVNYFVSVRGDFKKEPETGSGDPTVYYHLNRQYSGKSKMVFSPRTDDPKSSVQYPTFKDPATEVDIKIDDFWNTLYDPVCDVFQSIEETWKAQVYGASGDKKRAVPALLLINNEKRSYKTSFPLFYLEKKNEYDIEYNKKVMENSAGVRKMKDNSTKRLPFAMHEYPTVRGFIEKSIIIRSPGWSELKWDESFKGYSWTSEVLHPDEPLIEDAPESKDKVDILISYNFYRIKS